MRRAGLHELGADGQRVHLGENPRPLRIVIWGPMSDDPLLTLYAYCDWVQPYYVIKVLPISVPFAVILLTILAPLLPRQPRLWWLVLMFTLNNFGASVDCLLNNVLHFVIERGVGLRSR